MTGTGLTGAQSAPVNWRAEIEGAEYLLASGLCPPALRTPGAVLFVILAGRDLGLSPVASLRGLTIVQGKVEVSADLQLGLFHRAGGRSQWLELTEETAALRLVAPWLIGDHVSRFSLADARRAGLLNANYQRYPRAMLRSRAITQGLKDIGFDATAGCYAPGEISGEITLGDDARATVRTEPEEAAEATEAVEMVEMASADGQGPASGLVLPGPPSAWEGHGGQPLAQCSVRILAAFVAWADSGERRTRYARELAEAERLIGCCASLSTSGEPDSGGST